MALVNSASVILAIPSSQQAITIYRNSTFISHRKYSLRDNFFALVVNIAINDAGEYTCVTSSESRNLTEVTFLRVYGNDAFVSMIKHMA